MRIVRTPSGARFYGQPIGSVIQDDPEVPSSREVADWLRARHPDMDISLSPAPGGHLVLNMLRTPKGARGQGRASAVMEDLIAVADMMGLRVALTPEAPEGERMSKARLTEFYRRYGFVMNRSPNKDFTIRELMYRNPQPQGDGRDAWTEDELDLASELEQVGAEVHDDATVTLYHHTTARAADEVRRTGKLIGHEDGVFFTTRREQDSQAAGRGGQVITVRVPLSRLQIDDIFDDEAHLRIPTRRPGDAVAVADWLEEKALRRVRTAEGAEKYGQPIGTIITRDIASGVDPGTLERRPLGEQGRVAQTFRFTTEAGDEGIAKVMSNDNIIQLSARHQADAEYLTSLVGRAVGAEIPTVYQIDTDDLDADFDFDDPNALAESSTEIWMNFVPGVVASYTREYEYEHPDKLIHVTERGGRYYVHDMRQRNPDGSPTNPPGGFEFNEKWQAERKRLQMIHADLRRRAEQAPDDERLLGLVDLLVFNADRNRGNWIIAPDGTKVGIDNGAAFSDRNSGGGIAIGAGEMGGVQWPKVLGWFSEHFYAPKTDDDLVSGKRNLNPENDMSQRDMELIERALKDIKSEFQILGRMDWYSQMMRRFELLKARARGTRDRLYDDSMAESKALFRRVRTAEGAERYGQPIGSLITRDITAAVTSYQGDHKLPDPLQGRISETTRHVLPDGTEGYHKSIARIPYGASPGGEHQADAEYLTSLAGRAVGALMPTVLQVPPTPDPDNPAVMKSYNVWMAAVPGRTMFELREYDGDEHPLIKTKLYSVRLDKHGGADSEDTYKVREVTEGVDVHRGLDEDKAHELVKVYNEQAKYERAWAGGDDERLLGLLDLIVFNEDRHGGNWVVTQVGDEPSMDDRISGIDNGHAFHDQVDLEGWEQIRKSFGQQAAWPFTLGWFSLPFQGPVLPGTSGYRSPEGVPNDMSPHDMMLIRRSLEEIKPEFVRLGRESWWDAMMTRFTILEAQAQGTRDRLEGTL